MIYNSLVKKKAREWGVRKEKGEKKYEAMKEKARTNLFIGIYRFMVEELHLSGNRLFIYAAIYSFTRGTEGSFHGSRKYLAELFGISLRTVSRTLSELLSLGLIYSRGETQKGSKIYSADPKFFRLDSNYSENSNDNSENSSDNGTNGECASDVNFVTPGCQFAPTPVSDCPYPLANLAHNKKDDNKEILNTASTAAAAALRVREKTSRNDLYRRILSEAPAMRHEVIGDEYDPAYYQTFKYYGIDKLVRLTDDQYYYLNEWLGEDILRDYINKLEHYLKDTPGAATRVHSHFKVLCKWLLDDLGLKIRGETKGGSKK